MLTIALLVSLKTSCHFEDEKTLQKTDSFTLPWVPGPVILRVQLYFVSWLINQPPPPGPRTPPRNNHKGFLLGLIKGNQWLISHDYRGRYFPFFFADTTGLRGLKRLTLVTSLHGADYQQRNFQAPRKANSSGTYKYIYIYI